MPLDLSKNDPVTQRWRDTFVYVMLAVFFPLVFGMLAFLGASEAKARTTFLANLSYFDDRAVLLFIVRDEGPENKYWTFLPGANGHRIGSFVDRHLTEWLNGNGLRGTTHREF